MEMKEMVYDGNGKNSLLWSEIFPGGYGLAVVSIRGDHPCGYITFPGIEKLKSYEDIWIKDPDVHIQGRISWLGELPIGLPGTWLGWDYAHCDDYTYFGATRGDHGRKWKTEEIALSAITALKAFMLGNYTIAQNEDDEEDTDDGE